MQIIIKHTRGGRDRIIELNRNHAGMVLRAVLAAGATLWLLQQTVANDDAAPADIQEAVIASSTAAAAVDFTSYANYPPMGESWQTPLAPEVAGFVAGLAQDEPASPSLSASAFSPRVEHDTKGAASVLPTSYRVASDVSLISFRVSTLSVHRLAHGVAALDRTHAMAPELSVAVLAQGVGNSLGARKSAPPLYAAPFSPAEHITSALLHNPMGPQLGFQRPLSMVASSASTAGVRPPWSSPGQEAPLNPEDGDGSLWASGKHWLAEVTARWRNDDPQPSAPQAQAPLASAASGVTLYRSIGQRPSGAEAALQENLDVLARKVGEMEARLMQLDALSERLASAAGVEPEAYEFIDAMGGRGGPLVEDEPAALLDQLDAELDALQRRLSERTDFLSVLDERLTLLAASRARTPSTMPVRGYAYDTSSYGPRRDPITRRRAFHEGIDFAAPRGTPILAAAGGIVTFAGRLGGYGNMVEIDHGNQLVTRYAHASKILVKAGDLVYSGQKIATVGSTGRSTGPHLHFEVRVAGQAADPRLFLADQGQGGPALASR